MLKTHVVNLFLTIDLLLINEYFPYITHCKLTMSTNSSSSSSLSLFTSENVSSKFQKLVIKSQEKMKLEMWKIRKHEYDKSKEIYNVVESKIALSKLINENQKEIESFLSTITNSLSTLNENELKLLKRDYEELNLIEKVCLPSTWENSFSILHDLNELSNFVIGCLNLDVPTAIHNLTDAYIKAPFEPEGFNKQPLSNIKLIHDTFVNHPCYDNNVLMPANYDWEKVDWEIAQLRYEKLHPSIGSLKFIADMLPHSILPNSDK